MKIEFVSRQSIIDNILDRVNQGEKLTREMEKLLNEMSK